VSFAEAAGPASLLLLGYFGVSDQSIFNGIHLGFV
jgi:hypothetical protein